MKVITALKKLYYNIVKEDFENKEIYYVGGNDDLPAPLQGKEEAEAIQKLSKGDMEARQLLVEHNLRLVVYIAKKFENTGIGIEDLVSIGTIGLMKAINTFNAEKQIKLATYASRCIENEILMYLRRSSKLKSEVSIDEPLNKDGDGNELLLSDILGTPGDTTSQRIEDEVDKTLLKASISRLNNREKTIMELRFGFKTGDERTQKEVADMLGISQSYISRLEKKIINKMKKEILSKTGWEPEDGETENEKSSPSPNSHKKIKNNTWQINAYSIYFGNKICSLTIIYAKKQSSKGWKGVNDEPKKEKKSKWKRNNTNSSCCNNNCGFGFLWQV